MEEKTTGIRSWIDDRFPMTETWNKHVGKYYAPKNLNFWYAFGVFSLVVLVNQFLTGIWLAMYYTPTDANAFASVEHIMRDVRYGWLLRYMHSTGASAFFVVVYLHMYRGIMYGSYKFPRELMWIIGMLIYVVLLIESASGYVLPWGQMSFWATKVLTSLFTVIPWIGKDIALWLQGDYNVSGVTLHRFFAFHVVAIPLILLLLVWFHIIALHKVGSNNPTGIDNVKKVPFHPYYTVKDLFAVAIFLFVFAIVIFYAPTMGGYFLEHANFAPANPLVTPEHIAPPWYMAPFYSMLRAIPNKVVGVIISASAIAILFILPWLDRSPLRSIYYRGKWTKTMLLVFVVSFIGLGYFGTADLTDMNITFSRIFMIGYFAYFLGMPFYTKYEKTKKIPKDMESK